MSDITIESLGGYKGDAAQDNTWKPGTMFANEGKKLYDLVRENKPRLIVEVGRFEGFSTSCLALGVRDNLCGKVISIDCDPMAGQKIPIELRKFISFIHDDATTLNVQRLLGGRPIDMLLEDGAHTWGFTENILKRFAAKLVAVHDYKHPTCQETVAKDCHTVFGPPHEVFFEPPSDCGLAIYRFPQVN